MDRSGITRRQLLISMLRSRPAQALLILAIVSVVVDIGSALWQGGSAVALVLVAMVVFFGILVAGEFLPGAALRRARRQQTEDLDRRFSVRRLRHMLDLGIGQAVLACVCAYFGQSPSWWTCLSAAAWITVGAMAHSMWREQRRAAGIVEF